jgi:hypothetical protein
MPISSSLIAQEIHITPSGLAVYVSSIRVARDSVTAGVDDGSNIVPHSISVGHRPTLVIGVLRMHSRASHRAFTLVIFLMDRHDSVPQSSSRCKLLDQ